MDTNIITAMRKSQDELLAEGGEKPITDFFGVELSNEGISFRELKALRKIKERIKSSENQVEREGVAPKAIVLQIKFAFNLLRPLGFKIFRYLSENGETHSHPSPEMKRACELAALKPLPVILTKKKTGLVKKIIISVLVGIIASIIGFFLANRFAPSDLITAIIASFFIVGSICLAIISWQNLKIEILEEILSDNGKIKDAENKIKAMTMEELADAIFPEGFDVSPSDYRLRVKVNLPKPTKEEAERIDKILRLATQLEGRVILIAHKKAINLEILKVGRPSPGCSIVAIQTEDSVIFFEDGRWGDNKEEEEWIEAIKKTVSEKNLIFFSIDILQKNFQPLN
jgi:hypothetical protein